MVLDTNQLFPSFVSCASAFGGLTVASAVKSWHLKQAGSARSQPLRITIPLDRPGVTLTPRKLADLKGIEFMQVCEYDVLP